MSTTFLICCHYNIRIAYIQLQKLFHIKAKPCRSSRPVPPFRPTGLRFPPFSYFLYILLKRSFFRNCYSLIITLEYLINFFLFHLRRKKTDNRHCHQSGNHCCRSGIDGRLNKSEKHIGYRQSHTCNKSGPYTGFGNSFPIQPVEERRQKSTCQSTPGDAHQLGDKCGRIQSN